jgi:hypothetical protein
MVSKFDVSAAAWGRKCDEKLLIMILRWNREVHWLPWGSETPGRWHGKGRKMRKKSRERVGCTIRRD